MFRSRLDALLGSWVSSETAGSGIWKFRLECALGFGLVFTRLSLGDLLFVKSRKAKAERCLTFLLVVAFLLFTLGGRGWGLSRWSGVFLVAVFRSPFSVRSPFCGRRFPLELELEFLS